MFSEECSRQELIELAENDEWLLAGQAARVLGISHSTVSRLMQRGELKYRRQPGVGKWRRIDPVSLLENLRASEGAQ